MKCFAVSSALCVLAFNIIGVHSQWVWNRNLVPDQTSSSNGNSQNSNNAKFGSSSFNGNRADRDRFFVGQSSGNVPSSSNRVQGEARLIPSIISGISNSISSIASGGGGIPGLGGGGGGGGGILGALSSFPQLIAGLISGSGGSRDPVTLPGDTSNSGGSGGGGGASIVTDKENCRCFQSCFLPFAESGQGSCGNGMIMCCRATPGGNRIYFEPQRDRERERPTRTNSNIRQGLFNEILKGSSRIVDDTLDLILQPFLTEEDQQKLADRIADN